MILGNDKLENKIQIKNAGDNLGVEAGTNNGLIVVNQGMGYADTKALCIEITQEEIAKYRHEAAIEAEQRRDDLIKQVIEKLIAQGLSNQDSLAEFAKASMQFDYLEAQKSYMKAGTPELSAILSDLIVDRVKESSRTLLQITLGEAIQVAPKLIKSQMGSLALLFVVKRTQNLTVNSLDDFARVLKETIIPIFEAGVSKKASEYEHLVFTGCGQYLALRTRMASALKNAYPFLFMKGYLRKEIPSGSSGSSLIDDYPMIFEPCPDNTERFKIAVRSEKELNFFMKAWEVRQEDQGTLRNLLKNNSMNEDEIKERVITLVPEMREVFEYWDNKEISMLTLTSVGIVIGAQYSHMITGTKYDLSIWI